MSNQTVVLITGASSGVGHTARLFSQRNYKVFGTNRNPNNTGSISTVEMLSLDVRRDDSVGICVNEVLSRAGRIEVLVNNAGLELAGARDQNS